MSNQDMAVIKVIACDALRELIVGRLKNIVLFDFIQQRYLDGHLTVADRNWVICLLYHLGQGSITLEEIGKCFGGIERERVRQILERAGLDGLGKQKREETIRVWLGKFVIAPDSKELIKKVMQKVAGNKKFWTAETGGKTAKLKRLRVGKVLAELGMPFAERIIAGFVWKTLVGLRLIEEDGLLGVVLCYGFGWSQAQILDFFRANYFDKSGATLSDVLVKINDIACEKGLLTIASPQSVGTFLKNKGLKLKNRGCIHPAWLYRKQQI